MSTRGYNPGQGTTFTHLEVHSHYSLLRATVTIEQLVQAASNDRLSHLALTDTNVLYGAIRFNKACQAAGISPILGMTVPMAVDHEELSLNPAMLDGGTTLILLATGPDGYRSLSRLSSLIQSQPEQERDEFQGFQWTELKGNTRGLLCIDGGHSGQLYQLIKAGQTRAASRYVAQLGGIFEDRAFLGLELRAPQDKAIAREISGLSERFGLPPVAIQPIYYIERGTSPTIQLLQAIDRNCRLEEITEDFSGYHWRSPREMQDLFGEFPEALEQVAKIAESCQPSLPDGRPIWPKLDLPQGQTPSTVLAHVAETGLQPRYGPTVPQPVKDRLQKELDSIDRSGYSPLFLIVADIVRFARRNEIPVSTRGSVANSLVAYCTGITTVDPIKNELLFERFLNPSRLNPPDIDLDFCSRRRDEVLDYVRQTYGSDRVALVATINTLRAKSAVRETAKAFGLTEEEIKDLSARLPRRYHPNPYRRVRGTTTELAEELEDPRLQKIVRIAGELDRQPHHMSIHPGGLVITPGPLTDYVPVQWSPKGFLITQFDHRDIEALGLPKLDLLGIRALTVLADTVEMVQRFHDPEFQLDQIPLEDPDTATLLETGETIGVFQCESAGAQRTLRQLQAHNITDLAIANAFFKPGPATGGMAQAFIRRYRGEEEVQYLHPALTPILSSTHGVLLFQEQILRLATEIAGLNWEQADHLRRGMTKFKPEEMAALQADFIEGCCQPEPGGPGLSSVQAETLWEQVLAFAGYGFNRGHATAYAEVSYHCAYLKAHWPEAFLCARLGGWGGFHHPAIYMVEAKRLGFAIKPPHINHSQGHFSLSYEPVKPGDQTERKDNPRPTLWMGLGQVRNLRQQMVRTIIEERQSEPFLSLADLIQRVPLQEKELRHLVQCGALDGLGSSRGGLLSQVDTVARAGATQQMSFAFAPTDEATESASQRLEWESFILGQAISVHPLDTLENQPSEAVPLRDLTAGKVSRERTVTIAGIRLPGWTGGPGFFLGDQDFYITVRGDRDEAAPEPWRPLAIRGRWLADQWGTRWFQADSIREIS